MPGIHSQTVLIVDVNIRQDGNDTAQLGRLFDGGRNVVGHNIEQARCCDVEDENTGEVHCDQHDA